MGNSPLRLCIHQVWEKQTIQVVLPDGQVIYMQQPTTVADLLVAYPYHFVCHGSPPLLDQRLPANTKLEPGEIYYLIPVPKPYPPAQSGFQHGNSRPRSRKSIYSQQEALVEPTAIRVPNQCPANDRPSSVSNFTDCTQLNIKPQGCLIKFFVFRQNVTSASVLSEETFEVHDNECYTGNPPAQKGNQKSDGKHRGGRGRRPVISWKPHLESISETKAFGDVSKKNRHISNLSMSFLSSISNIKMSAVAPAPRMSPPRTTPGSASVGIEQDCQKLKSIAKASWLL
ncbi:hypothetical protein R1sor_004314 [Riccia sorocarpa]|uniref:DUF4384 domain-containing protein n=1 Tax=Riccia sorocarpa TaxID=122646 RepID=A0ABD3HGD1_9MARC